MKSATKVKALVFALVSVPAIGNSCLVLGPGGTMVRTTSEAAIIVWDASKHEEHFIRWASFETGASSVGFLVPTPTQPKLREASNRALNDLIQFTSKRVPIPVYKGGPKSEGSRNPVIRVSHVGGWEQTMLSLANGSAVESWLTKHDFVKTDETRKWLDYYGRMGWVLTAFRMDARSGLADLKLVTMSFHTDRPFYPYKEPTSPANPARRRDLRVFFLSDSPASATFAGGPWVAKREMSEMLTDSEIAELTPSLPGVPVANSRWLTTFLDQSSPRKGTDDVFFSSPKSVSLWPIAGGVALVAAAFFGLRVRIGQRRQPA